MCIGFIVVERFTRMKERRFHVNVFVIYETRAGQSRHACIHTKYAHTKNIQNTHRTDSSAAVAAAHRIFYYMHASKQPRHNRQLKMCDLVLFFFFFCLVFFCLSLSPSLSVN